MEESIHSMIKLLRGKYQENFPMRRITWFRTGGCADVMFQPQDIDDLKDFLAILPINYPLQVVGLGSNILVRDSGIRGVVLRLSQFGFGKAEVTSDFKIIAGASCSGKLIANLALQHGIGGFHFLCGIPGSVGGAAYMNSGANGYDTSELIIEVHVVDRMGNQHIIPKVEMGYGYRHSTISKDFIITHVVFQGFAEDSDVIRSAISDVIKHRELVQPIKEKTGGSTFKNPIGHSAWKLIDDAQCRGLTFGGAKISELHCNFMINTGNATGYDLEYLGEIVRKKVFDQSGIILEWEIKRVGDFIDNYVVDSLDIS
ncbi:MAG: UDP-N-acetylenolpyruvoylglucosamine reductase [Candidatus Liberibacter europaeus]|uniref:UDP-N-acetylenolpyruvoylglucosamine reductase n=1 Tax=Candidatus Liberibacter europaeus TaxID=744859 RepID=A0A2T4VWL2_9HYPH|nr:UDP-N-acetylenolpyruvoylglucosamine reductase [Candidatus Liberibacter europaeus]PTL86156.1 MAG: UDP-N-acetylenolpyruvoylglucosamine reductase [Candidatus Liberibacter europaeus]